MKNAPCLNCPDRYPACHDRCEKYQSYKKVTDAEREARHKEIEIDIARTENVERTKRRISKRRNFIGGRK